MTMAVQRIRWISVTGQSDWQLAAVDSLKMFNMMLLNRLHPWRFGAGLLRQRLR